jgi:Cation efflux family
MVIAVAKLIGGVVSGSTGMLAEAAHSAADSVNEIFLAVGFYREKLQAMLEEDEAVEQIVSLRAIYSGPEEVVVMAKVRPSAKMNIENLKPSDGRPRSQNPQGAPGCGGCVHRHHRNPRSRTFANSNSKRVALRS